MKNLILFVALLSGFNSIGQLVVNSQNNIQFGNVYLPAKLDSTKNIESIELTGVNKKGENRITFKKYDRSGRLIQQSKKNKNGKVILILEFENNEKGQQTASRYYNKGKLRTEWRLTYNSIGKQASSSHYKKGKLQYSEEKDYNKLGKLAEKRNLNPKGNIKYKTTFKYNKDSCISDVSYYRNEKLTSRFVYEYHSKCEKKKTTKFNNKGEIKGVWSYECKTEGEKLEKKKNETQICKWDETTKDFLIKVTQTFNEKGEIRKTVSKYAIADTSIVEINKYDENENLTVHSTYQNSKKKPLTRVQYKNGKKRFENYYKYENGKVVSAIYIYKNKTKTEETYKYENGNLVESSRNYKNGKSGRKTVYSYQNSLVVSIITINLKGEGIYNLSMKYGKFNSLPSQ